MSAIESYGSVHWSCARTRLNFGLLEALEEELSYLFRSRVVAFSSVMLANLGALPLIASGHLTDGIKPVVVFDRLCHASLSYHKPVVANETEIVTIGHNDMVALEELCKTHPCVAYIADGVYSMGGSAPIPELLRLQEKYNLFLYIDDAHGVSIFGKQGEGFARSQLPPDLGKRTIVAASLGKGFGASGGILLLGTEHQESLFRRYAQPYAFSAAPNLAAVGAALASAEIHASKELGQLQTALSERIRAFDNLVWTPQKGHPLPIRTLPIGKEEDAILAAKDLMDRGIYTSAIFFPTVARGAAGLRICLTANHSLEEVKTLCSVIDVIHQWQTSDPPSKPTKQYKRAKVLS